MTARAPDEPPDTGDVADEQRWILNTADAGGSPAPADDDADPDRSDTEPDLRWRRLLD